MSDRQNAVVVGVDGSEGSLGAARWAGTLADKMAVPLHLVHSLSTAGSFIADATVIAIRAAATPDQRAAAEKMLTAVEQRMHEDIDSLSISTAVTRESAAKELIRLSHSARMVVVGCGDVNSAAALLVGSTSLSVATCAHCPVVLWRGVSEANTAPVVVGVDGTSAGSAALAAAFEFAHLMKAPLKAVHAWFTATPDEQLLLPYFLDWDAIEAAEWSLLTTAVGEYSERFPEVEVRMFVERAKPTPALMRHLADAQLVVVGNHRRNSVTAALLGSTCLNLLHHSHIPVMVCQAAETDEQ